MPFHLFCIAARALRRPGHWLLIIGTLMMGFLLSGCSTVRLTYNNAPALAYWWLDGYFDFASDQATRVRADLQSAHQWHRTQELPLIVQTMSELQTRAVDSVPADAVCTIATELQNRYEATVRYMIPTMVAVAPMLGDAQIKHLERELAKRRADWQRDYTEGSAAERLDKRVKKAVERTEMFYGKLTPEQRELVRGQVVESVFDTALQSRESQRRHQDALQVLTQISNGSVAASGHRAALTALVQRSLSSPDSDYRQYLARLTQQGCANIAALHNRMSPKQRATLAENLKDYEQALRAVMAP